MLQGLGLLVVSLLLFNGLGFGALFCFKEGTVRVYVF